MQVHQPIKISQDNWEQFSSKNCSLDLLRQMKQAAQIGFFYLEIPENCKKFLSSTVEFANTFYKNSEMRKTPKADDFTAFVERSKFQCNSLYVHETKWSTFLTEEVAAQAKTMNALCIEILKVFLLLLNVPEDDQELATGGAISGTGQSQFVFHHYNPEKKVEGLVAHKDFGLITLLFINKRGLQFKVGDTWVEAPPIKDHFVVNLGRTFETLINDKRKLIAPIHRVIQCTEDRISFVAQIDNNLESKLYQRKDGKLVVFHSKCREYVHEVIASGNLL